MTRPRPRQPGAFDDARRAVGRLDERAAGVARAHHGRLTKPPGSLGAVEDLGVRLAAIAGESPPPVPEPVAVAVFAGDHGVVEEGVTAWPTEVTAQMVANLVAGGAAANALARQVGAHVWVVDVGVAREPVASSDTPGRTSGGGRFLDRNVRRGTRNIRREDAMTDGEAIEALDAGAALAAELVDAGFRCLVTGEMGIGNTTPSAALVAALTGRPPEEVTGRGAGADDETLARKLAVVRDALARAGDADDPGRLLAALGGLEIAAIAGFVVGGAAARVPVVIDGLIADAALLAAVRLCPPAAGFAVAGHGSTEPGAPAALDALGLEPLLDLGLRLGEGTGALLAVPLLSAAARVLAEMATFDAAGVVEKPG